MPKVVFFPHSDKEFEDEYASRNWLDVELRVYRKGEYHMKKAQGLGELEEGSIVFFHRNNWVVGYAIVEKPPRKTTKQEKDRNGEEYENIVKFIPESISAWSDNQFLSRQEVNHIIGKQLLQGFPRVDNLSQLLELFKRVAERSQP